MLLLRERDANAEQNVTIYYYGKTGDSGRDIVRVAPEGTTLIQCKHFTHNVGVGDIREELAKLCHNVHENVIDRPDAIAFYVTSDLTAGAQDMLRSWDMWGTNAEQALKAYLKRDPSVDLLNFAKTWRPGISWQNGRSLTERVRKTYAESLIDEFFEFKKVSVGDVRTLDAPLIKMDNKLDLLLKLQLGSSLQGLQELVRAYEELNPALAFEVTTTPTNITFFVRAKSGAEDYEIGHLRFPSTMAGERGREKLRQVIEEGRDVELLDGEFEWESHVRSPTGDEAPREGVTRCIRIHSQLPERRIPVRLDSQSPRYRGQVAMAFLSLERIGTKEIAFRISGGQFAGDVSMVLRRDGDQESAKVKAGYNLGRVPAKLARATLELFLSLSDQGTFDVVSLELDMPLFTASVTSSPFRTDVLENSVNMISKLEALSARLSIDLRYPDEVDTNAFHTIDLAFEGTNRGQVEDRSLRVTQKLSFPVAHARTVVQSWRDGKNVDLILTEHFSWNFRGVNLPVGPTSTTLHGVQPLQPFDEVDAAIASAGVDGNVEISFTTSHMTHEFLTFKTSSQ